MHQEDQVVQHRVFYLFNRFIYSAKSLLQSQISLELVRNILSRLQVSRASRISIPNWTDTKNEPLQDLLVVTATLAATSPEPLSNTSLVKAVAGDTSFTAQLYLFETVGTLISILNQVPADQVVLLRAALTPLLATMSTHVRASASSEEDFLAVLQVHHLILAVGNVGKGFPDLSSRVPTATGQWVAVFKEATEAILNVAKTMAGFIIIREAVSFFLFHPGAL